MSESIHYRFGAFRLDPETRTLARGGQLVRLMPKDVALLLALVERRGEVVTRERLLSQVWPGVVVEDGNLARHVATLRQALGDTREAPAYIETLPKVGYRFVAPVATATCGEDPPGATPIIPPAAEPLPPREAHTATRRRAAMQRLSQVILGLGALALLSVIGWRTAGQKAEAYGPIRSVAVLPVENLTGDPRMDHVAAELAEMLVNDLGRIKGLEVLSRAESRRFAGSTMSARAIGRELEVEGLLEAAIVRADDRIRVTAELVDVRTDRLVWSEVFESTLDDLMELQDLIAGAAVEALGLGGAPPGPPPGQLAEPRGGDGPSQPGATAMTAP